MNGPDNRPLYQRLRNETDRYMLCIDSAGRDRTRVEVLRSGADDAVSVPVTPDEIAARCHALLRRPREIRTDWDPVQPSIVALGPLVIDSGRHEIRLGEVEIPATRIEFSLLEHLCRRPTEVASRADLLESVWGPNWVGDTHVVDVHLSNLRRKLDGVAPDLRIVHTVRGVGFRISNELLDAAEAHASTGMPTVVRNVTDTERRSTRAIDTEHSRPEPIDSLSLPCQEYVARIDQRCCSTPTRWATPRSVTTCSRASRRDRSGAHQRCSSGHGPAQADDPMTAACRRPTRLVRR